MKLSIITINYNDAPGLERTIRSVINQDFDNFEYIVIDGGSTDGSYNVIQQFDDKITYWVSEPDSGIYNAMNKGIKRAKGEYILFLNSGDYLYNETVLTNVFKKEIDTDLIYGDLHRIFPDGNSDITYMPDNVDITYILGHTLGHPATFIRRCLFDKYGYYREDLKIISDWAFFLKIIAFGRITLRHIPIVITTFTMDGISNNPENQHIIEQETDKILKEYFSTELLEICNNYNKYYSFYHCPSVSFARRVVSFIRQLLSIRGWERFIYKKRIKPIIYLFNKTVRSQKKDTSTIPIIIISYNRLNDLKQLVSFLIERNHKNIVIVDNQSTYPPLLDYYNEIKDKVTIEIMDRNYGHLVFWKNRKLYDKYTSGYYIVTDSDIIPNKNLPANYIKYLMHMLDHHKKITKVGFALRLDDIPDSFQPKSTVIEWEKQFWIDEIRKDTYNAALDTTFAIYPPKYDFTYSRFYKAIRIAGNYTAKHGGWYLDSKNLTDEDKFYFKLSSNSNSWKLNDDGELNSEMY